MSFDPETGQSVLYVWLAAVAAALLVAASALVFVRARTGMLGALMRGGVVALSAVLGAVAAWTLLSQTAGRDHEVERRALQIRADALAVRSLAPGSPLACLDAVAGDSVEAACERALFASPATVAAASSYVTARLSLLADMVAYVRVGGANIENSLVPLRHAVEADRFGFLAHALAVRDRCTSKTCQPLDVLRDQSQVRANLSGETLDRYLDHYLTVWAQSPDGMAADGANPPLAAASQPGAPAPRKVVNIDFPSAASIPAISIMNPEPAAKGPPAAANPPAADTGAGASSKRPRKQAAAAPAQPAPSVDAPVDPVWTPAPAAAAQAAAASGPAAPIQLTPAVTPQ